MSACHSHQSPYGHLLNHLFSSPFQTPMAQLPPPSTGLQRLSKYFMRGSFIYSIGFGATLGVGLAGLAVFGRTVKLFFSDAEYYRQMSRNRYLEKQAVFNHWLEGKLAAHFIGNEVVQSYNPVDTRMPFEHIQDRFRF